MNPQEIKRKHLFDLFSENLSLFQTKVGLKFEYDLEGEVSFPTDFYICPLCGLGFGRESLDQSISNPLTIEHIEPMSIAGKKPILACKSCNNRLGKKLDAKLAHFARLNHTKINKTTFHSNNGLKVNGTLGLISAGELRIVLNIRESEYLQRQFSNLVNNWNGNRISVRFNTPSKRTVSLAILKAAHLKMFSFFGFGYLFTHSIDAIRRQIANPTITTIENIHCLNPQLFPENESGIHYISEPAHLKSYVVCINAQIDGVNQRYAIAIPGPSQECLNIYQQRPEEKDTITVSTLEKYPDLTNPDHILAYSQILGYELTSILPATEAIGDAG